MSNSEPSLVADAVTLPSKAIDGLARLLASAAPDTRTDMVHAQKQRGADLIRNLTVGGAALGGGVSAAVVLANYLKGLRQEAEMEDESRLNDDTLYIPKMASDGLPNRWLAPGLAVTGGVLAAGGTYALVQALYSKLRKRQLEELLDDAQSETLALADVEAGRTKSAASFSTSDALTAMPVALPLLLALAAAGVTHHSLSKAFPTVKAPKSNFPKRIRMSTKDESAETDTKEEAEKVASFNPEREHEIERAAQEYLLVLTSQISDQTKAATLTSDILRRATEEGTIPMTQIYMEGGLEALAESVKTASAAELTETVKCAAAFAIARNPFLAPAVTAVAGAELLDMLPVTSFILEKSGSAQADAMAGIGAILGITECRPKVAEWLDKSAASNPELLEELLTSAMNGSSIPGDVEIAQRDGALSSDQSGSMGEDSEGQDEDGENPTEVREDDRDLVEDLIEDESALENLPP